MQIYLNAYLEKNFGDDLFVKILVDRYKNHTFYAISNSYQSKDNLQIYKNTLKMKILNKLELKEKVYIDSKDISVSIGGSMYIEGLSPIERKKIYGNNPYYILGSNFGPYKTEEFYKKGYELFKNAEDVCVRDKYTYNLFKELPNVRYAPDIVFTLDTSKINISEEKKVIISVIDCENKLDKQYQEKYENMIKEMIQFFVDNGYKVGLMSFCKRENDEIAIERILNSINEDIKQKVEKYFYDGNVEEALDYIAQSQIVVGTRFHANILGLLLGKTVIPVIYSNKTTEFLRDIQFEGKAIDIKGDCKFNLTLDDLKYKKDVTKEIEKAQEQFKALDKLLK